MADTMATPCSYPLPPGARSCVGHRTKSCSINNLSHPRATGSKHPNPLILRRHLVRDQEVGGSNPLAPTNSLNKLEAHTSGPRVRVRNNVRNRQEHIQFTS